METFVLRRRRSGGAASGKCRALLNALRGLRGSRPSVVNALARGVHGQCAMGTRGCEGLGCAVWDVFRDVSDAWESGPVCEK